jgi:hypothetical protein
MEKTKKDTMIPARRTDVARLNTITSAMGLARRGERIPRVQALSYILDRFEENTPEELSPYLNPPAARARRR